MKKQTGKTYVKRTKKSRKERFVNILTFTLLGAIFALCAIAVYFQEMRKLEKQDKYLERLPSLEDTISHEKVCMDDDLYSPHTRFPVLVFNRTYFGCNQKATRNLSSNEYMRMAIDPVNKAKVDKALAIIALHPDKNGRVIYFGSRQTYQAYLKILKKP